MSKRLAKVNSLIKTELGKILSKEMIFPPGMLVTIIDVETSVDLKHAKIKIDVIPPEKIKQALKILDNNIFELQQILNKTLVLKYVPRIRFLADEGQRKVERIEEVLRKVREEE